LRRLSSTTAFLGLVLQVSALVAQLSTEDHLAEPGFWPTQAVTARDDFKGPQACARCHATKFASARTTPMGVSAVPASSSPLLHSQPHLSFSLKQYEYRIDTEEAASHYSITDGVHSIF
jgi:hypothetical protein